MFKPLVTVPFILMALMISSVSEDVMAQVKASVGKKSVVVPRKRQFTYIMPTPRVKAKKFVYQIETRDVTRATPGRLLPSQVGVGSRSISGDDSAVTLREKPKRSIASEGN